MRGTTAKGLGVLLHYLTSGYLSVTPNTTVVGSAAITGPLAGNTLCDWVQVTKECKELRAYLTLQALSGTSPTVTFYFYVLDPIEPSNNDALWGLTQTPSNPAPLKLTLNATALTAPGTVVLAITRDGTATAWVNGVATVLGHIGVPVAWQVGIAVGGTGPSASVIGTWEARK